MTDSETLLRYRLNQAQESLNEARRMSKENFSSRTIINRCYYAAFYILLAVLIKKGVPLKTSKHVGVISIFDKEFVLPGKIEKRYSEIVHRLFKVRQMADYKELVHPTLEEAISHLSSAEDFVNRITRFIESS